MTTLEHIIKSNRMPVLFVGSGLSIRYLENYPSWKELLERVADEIGLDKYQLKSIIDEINKSNQSVTEGEINQKIGSKLRIIFNERIEKGLLNPIDIFTNEELLEIENNNINFFNYLISKQFSNPKINENMLPELEQLKKLRNKISMVYTTNYDTFLESYILGNEFKVYDNQSKYYFRDNLRYAELFKIHGCITNPNSIILTEDDYLNFETNTKLIPSKLLSTLIDYPIIFLGYSLRDQNILNILETLFSSFPNNILNEISKYILYINYDQNQNDFVYSTTNFGKNKKFSIETITTNNYLELYKILNKMVFHTSPGQIRKYKNIFTKIIREQSPSRNVFASIDVNEIENIDQNKIVIAFGNNDNIKTIKESVIEHTFRNTRTYISDLVYDKELFDPKFTVTKWFDNNQNIQTNTYFPVFIYLKESGLSLDETSDKFQKSYNDKLNKIEKFKNNIESFGTLSLSDIDSLSLEKTANRKKLVFSALNLYKQGAIERSKVLELFQMVINKDLDNTYFRQAVSFLDIF